MTSMRDYADKTYLQRNNEHLLHESTVEKVAAVIGLFSMIVFVAGILILPMTQH